MPYVRPSVVCAGVAVTEFTDRGEVPYVFFPLNIDVVVPFFWTGKVLSKVKIILAILFRLGGLCKTTSNRYVYQSLYDG